MVFFLLPMCLCRVIGDYCLSSSQVDTKFLNHCFTVECTIESQKSKVTKNIMKIMFNTIKKILMWNIGVKMFINSWIKCLTGKIIETH